MPAAPEPRLPPRSTVGYDPYSDPAVVGIPSQQKSATGPITGATTVSITSLEAPADAKKAFEKGMRAFVKQKWQEAQTHLEKAVALYPRYAEAWFRLGACHQVQNRVEEARKAYAHALEADSKYPDPYLPLAKLALGKEKWQETVDITDKLVRLDPAHFPEAYYYSSVANLKLLQFDRAEKSALEAIRLDTAHQIPKAEQLLGLALANKKDYVDAETHLQAYLEHEHNPAELALAREQLAIVKQLAGPATPPGQQASSK